MLMGNIALTSSSFLQSRVPNLTLFLFVVVEVYPGNSFNCVFSLSLFSCLAFCRGRVVRVPKGPLIRVMGTEVVIPCNVSDYDGPSEQNFDWEFSRETDFVRIVSTWDSTFTSEEYQKRVGLGDIKLRRSSNDAVELVIRNIQPTDQGRYKCSTPSTDATVQGNYDAEVQVKGISEK